MVTITKEKDNSNQQKIVNNKINVKLKNKSKKTIFRKIIILLIMIALIGLKKINHKYCTEDKVLINGHY